MQSINPLLSMWLRPRETIRYIVDKNPNYGVFWLSAIYIFQSLLFLFNFWSFGLVFPHYALTVPLVIVAPLLGFVWVCFYGWLLQKTGRWLGGHAPVSYLKAASAWSRLPMTLALFLWVGLWLKYPKEIFIQFGPGSTVLFLHMILLFLKIWTIALLVQAIREVQCFSRLKALFNVFIAWTIYSLIATSIIFALRFLSIYLLPTSASFSN